MGRNSRRTLLNELAHHYITERATPLRHGAAIALGLFIGCLPVYGLHLPLCLIVGSLLGLNRLKLYLAANISNPVLSPFLLFAAVQIAGRLENGSFYPISLEAVRTLDPWAFGAQVLWGSALLGTALAIVGFPLAYGTKLRSRLPTSEEDLVEQAAKRYVPHGLLTWWRANNRLRRDSLYRDVVRELLRHHGGTLVHVGCGRGELLAAIRAGEVVLRGETPSPGARPLELLGIENDPQDAAIARSALDGEATILDGDPRTVRLPRCRWVLLLDVLARLPGDQDRTSLVERAGAAVEEGGTILIRDRTRAGSRWAPFLESVGLQIDLESPPDSGIVRAVRKPSLAPSSLRPSC